MTEILIITIIICVYLMIKNGFTARNQSIISDAIYAYRIDMIRQGKYDDCTVNYNDMEHYVKTWLRYYDFGYTNILPVEKYEIIKPYIKLKENKNVSTNIKRDA